jgi:hypothetical protein
LSVAGAPPQSYNQDDTKAFEEAARVNRKLASLAYGAALAGSSIAMLIAGATQAAANPLGFAPRQYVDGQLAGGEPFVLADNVHHTLIYTAHEGTTHIYRPGLEFPLDFGPNYRNQVNLWRSDDNGRNWKRLNYIGTGFQTNPGENTGFSDPDLTQDGGGRVYDTGIDLANDSVFSTPDGGKHWDRGTAQCHEGDRPWLAGGRRNEVFMATNTEEAGHQVYRSKNGGDTCSVTGIPDQGDVSGGRTYVGDGKLLYDRRHDQLVEPIVFQNADGDIIGLGTSTWHRGDPAFKPGRMIPTTMFAHWPAIAIDRGGTTYMVWDTDPRRNDKNGCGDTLTGNGATGSPLPNKIEVASSSNYGRTWSRPFTIAHPHSARAFWPWIAAGSAGRIAVTWYRTDRLRDPDCQKVTVTIGDAHVFHATNPTRRTVQRAAASRGAIHRHSTVCQGGTTCVATGQDRRLGDFFTNALDPRGCELIASGDTTQPSPLGGPRPTALPILIRQNSGRRLVGRGSC